MLKEKLLHFHDPAGPERCGLVLSNMEIVELPNLHLDPMDGFAIEDELIHQPGVVGTWHTHPRTGPNLSVADYRAFLAYPKHCHYVVAATDVWCFSVRNGILLLNENLSPWLSSGPSP